MILHSRTISSKEVECIDSYLIEQYIVEDHDFPNALCTDCDMKLNKKIKSNGHHLVPKVDDYDSGRSKYLLSSSDCNCRICTVAKVTGLADQSMVKKKKEGLLQQIYQGSNHFVPKLRSSRRNKVWYIEELVSSPNNTSKSGFCEGLVTKLKTAILYDVKKFEYSGGGGEGGPLTKFFKRGRGGLTGAQLLEGGCWEWRCGFFRGGGGDCNF